MLPRPGLRNSRTSMKQELAMASNACAIGGPLSIVSRSMVRRRCSASGLAATVRVSKSSDTPRKYPRPPASTCKSPSVPLGSHSKAVHRRSVMLVPRSKADPFRVAITSRCERRETSGRTTQWRGASPPPNCSACRAGAPLSTSPVRPEILCIARHLRQSVAHRRAYWTEPYNLSPHPSNSHRIAQD